MRKYFFAKVPVRLGTKSFSRKTLRRQYRHYVADIRNRAQMEEIVKQYLPNIVIHTAAQPSHDWAAKEPHTDFSINALGTLVLLESVRQYLPRSDIYFYLNEQSLRRSAELPSARRDRCAGKSIRHMPSTTVLNESMSIDQTLHSVFGASKSPPT